MPSSSLNKTILVVDDDASTRDWLIGVLTGHGYRALSAAHGDEALRYLQANPLPDLMLLDMLMPNLDGWELLAHCQDDECLARLRVLIMTGTVLSREWAQSHGCVGFLRKPFEVEELLGEVRRCLSDSGA